MPASRGPPMSLLSRLPDRCADGAPHRDLYLSASHALYFDGLLVIVESLVNGSTIVRRSAEELRRLEYFNIELAEQEVK